MPVIKLDAIPSTNDFLKELAASGPLEPFTVAVAETQTKGRGQAGSSWFSEPGKNLTFSVYVPDAVAHAQQLFGLNVAVALAVANALEQMGTPRISVKWPNDILSGNRKLGGILIENVIGSRIASIVGIGVNVNQSDFNGLPTATSIVLETGKEFSKEQLMESIVNGIRGYLDLLPDGDQKLWDAYHDKLFMKGRTAMFASAEGNRFMAIVKSVRRNGRLELVLQDGSLRDYGVREVSMIY